MKLALTLEADSINAQALNMGRIVVDVDGIKLAELINKVAENGYSLRVVDEHDATETPATSASSHQLPEDNTVIQSVMPLTTETALDMGHIVVDIDGVNITELINKAAENGYSLRVVDDRDSTETPATYASPHQLL